METLSTYKLLKKGAKILVWALKKNLLDTSFNGGEIDTNIIDMNWHAKACANELYMTLMAF